MNLTFPVVFAIAGVLFLLLSFFTLATSSNEKIPSFTRRENVDRPAITIGGILLVVGLGIYAWEVINSQPTALPATTQTLTIVPSPLQTQEQILLTPQMTTTDDSVINSLPIESIPSFVFSYEGINEPGSGYEGAADLLIHIMETSPTYTLQYTLPEDDTPAYVGLAFAFDEEQNLSRYNHIQITVDFGKPDTSCEFYIKDIADTPQTTKRIDLLNSLPNTKITVNNLRDNKYTFTIPLEINFPDTNFFAISEIGFTLGTPPEHGYNDMTFSDINFLLP